MILKIEIFLKSSLFLALFMRDLKFWSVSKLVQGGVQIHSKPNELFSEYIWAETLAVHLSHCKYGNRLNLDQTSLNYWAVWENLFDGFLQRFIVTFNGDKRR